jgi:pimeloyl-ACP methyl ester carboxylesterase
MLSVSSIDGTEISYEVLGERGIPLVFIPGWGAITGKEVWKYQLLLSSEYRLVLIDLAGCGNSGKDRKAYTMELYGHDVKSVSEELDLKDIILIGWSMGGAVILEAEKLISERVLGLIAVDSLFGESPGDLYAGHNDAEVELNIKPLEEDFIGTVTGILESYLSDKFDSDDITAVKGIPHQLDQRSMISAWEGLLRWDMHKVLPISDKPMKCIVAGKTLPEGRRTFYSGIFDAIFLEDLGHLLVWEDPTRFNEALMECIRELAQGG